jgi:hypothetical protein
MKEIILKIDEKVLEEVKSGIVSKQMCGAFYGICDATLYRIVNSIEAGDKEVSLSFKKEKKKEGG